MKTYTIFYSAVCVKWETSVVQCHQYYNMCASVLPNVMMKRMGLPLTTVWTLTVVNRSPKGIGGLFHIGSCDISAMNVVKTNGSRRPFSLLAFLGILQKITEEQKTVTRNENIAPKC